MTRSVAPTRFLARRFVAALAISFAALVTGLASAQAPVPAAAQLNEPPTPAPAWIAGYRVRYALRVVDDPTPPVVPAAAAGAPATPIPTQPATVVARIPASGWLKPDGSDIAVLASTGEALAVSILSHDPAGDTIIQFPRKGNDRWYWAYASNPAVPANANPALPEGVIAEYRQWAGESIDSWAAVVDGLKKSDNVIGNAPVMEIVQNSNPARPDDPRRFAASYRGYLNIKTAGAYRFLTNSEDASFLFIDGKMVFERPGINKRITGQIPIARTGAEVNLTAGVHPFEVHHVMGNNPDTYGFLALLWLPPGAKAWAFVPMDAYVRPLLANVAAVEEPAAGQAAIFSSGVEDTLTANGMTLFLQRFEAGGNITNPELITWDFGDGSTGKGRSPRHVYFKGGIYTVTLNSPGMAPYKRGVYVWPVPGDTNPLSLSRAIAALETVNWPAFPPEQVNQMFDFLLQCEQPERWPLLEKVSRRVLARTDIDPKFRAVAYATLMEATARQGRGKEAIAMLAPALKEFAKTPSLQVTLKLAAAGVYHYHLREPNDASKLYQSIIDENRRIETADVRIAAIRMGDLMTESGDLVKAAEFYRLANTLGGASFASTAQTDAITRGAMLRVAEQKLRGGDIRQTRRMLDEIELKYPEQKLEGLYRFLRAEADRLGGRYEDAIQNYEVLIKLTAWAGFRDKALYGIADSYYRMGDYDNALKWLSTVEENYQKFFEEQKLGDYRRAIEGRLSRLRAAQKAAAAKPGDKFIGILFAGYHASFEPEQKDSFTPVSGWSVIPAAPGMLGNHVGAYEAFPTYRVSADGNIRLRNLQSNAYYWVEFWVRETMSSILTNPYAYLTLTGSGTDMNPVGGSVQPGFERTFGSWRRMGYLMKTPVTQDGVLTFSFRQVVGLLEFDDMSITPVTDRQYDSLSNFLEGR